MLCKKTVGESGVDCSTVMVINRRRHVDHKIWGERMEDDGIEARQMNGVGETEHTAGWDRQIGRGLVVHWFKGSSPTWGWLQRGLCGESLHKHDQPTSLSPWYNCNGWLGVKHQVTYLPPVCQSTNQQLISLPTKKEANINKVSDKLCEVSKVTACQLVSLLINQLFSHEVHSMQQVNSHNRNRLYGTLY